MQWCGGSTWRAYGASGPFSPADAGGRFLVPVPPHLSTDRGRGTGSDANLFLVREKTITGRSRPFLSEVSDNCCLTTARSGCARCCGCSSREWSIITEALAVVDGTVVLDGCSSAACSRGGRDEPTGSGARSSRASAGSHLRFTMTVASAAGTSSAVSAGRHCRIMVPVSAQNDHGCVW